MKRIILFMMIALMTVSLTLAATTYITTDGKNQSIGDLPLFIDNTNNRIGIGNTAPSSVLDLTGDFTLSGSIITSDSVIIGSGASASSSNQPVAIGSNANAAGIDSIAIGDGAYAQNTAVAVGASASATHTSGGTAYGYNSNSSAAYATAIGFGPIASGTQSTALGGLSPYSLHTNSIALGTYVTSNRSGAITLGYGVSHSNRLINQRNNSLLVGFNSIPALFLNTTRLGILTTTPTQALDVNGSINISDASGRLYAPEICLAGDCQTTWPAGGSGGSGGWTNTSTTTSTSLNVNVTNSTGASKFFVNSTNGLVGINTSNPQYLLDVSGNVRFNGSIILQDRFAIGNGASTETGMFPYALAIGTDAFADETGIAIGWGANASGANPSTSSIAIGRNAIADNYQAIAIGTDSVAEISSVSIGPFTDSLGTASMVLGYFSSTKSDEIYSMALGPYTNTLNSNSIVLGTGKPSRDLNNSRPQSLLIGWNGTGRYFFNETGAGIFTTNPTQALDVNGSINISGASGKLHAPEVCLAGDCQTSWPSGSSLWTNSSNNLTYTGGSILVSGTTGSTPASGTGTRFMWIPGKSAIRAGVVTGTEWDDAEIGTSSAAFGNTVEASGAYSTALGRDTVASANYALAAGQASLANAEGATAFGTTFVHGTYSFSAGSSNLIDSNGDYAIALGRYVDSSAESAMVIGTGVGSVNKLDNAISHSLMVGFNSQSPTLFINGSGMGIFTTTLTSALDVNGSINISGASGKLHAPEICLNGDCQTSWPAGGGSSGGWTNTSTTTSTSLNVNVSGNMTPSVNNTYSLGTPTKVWKDIYVGSNSLYIGGLSLSNNGGSLQWNGIELTTASSGAAAGWNDTGSIIDLVSTSDHVNMNTMYINNSAGTVGIGTAEATATLFIDGASDRNQLLIQGANTQNSDIIVIENSTGGDYLTVQGDGDTYARKLGVGKTSPSTTVDVNGTFNVTASDGSGIHVAGDGNVIIRLG